MSNPTHANRTRNAGKITLHKPATVRKASAALRSLTEEQRRTMIAEAAYYVAERRGFDACSYASIVRWVCVLGVSVVLGCTLPRRDAPPTLFSSAAPVGFPGTVRFLSVDRATVEARSDAALQGLKKASKDGVVRFLALSGGGAAGAFGAGTLIGLGHRDERPQYDVVTGVSAGALIAPFAFLGSEWDSQLADAITSGRSEHMTLHGLAQLLFGVRHRSDALLSFVDHYITKDLVDAVAKEAAAGRILWVATTALDKEELVIWDMGIIAQHGGEAARKLFRDVLVASASVPGVFSPIIIHVEKNGVRYDEMHVDGNASASLFVAPCSSVLCSTRSECARRRTAVRPNKRQDNRCTLHDALQTGTDRGAQFRCGDEAPLQRPGHRGEPVRRQIPHVRPFHITCPSTILPTKPPTFTRPQCACCSIMVSAARSKDACGRRLIRR